MRKPTAILVAYAVLFSSVSAHATFAGPDKLPKPMADTTVENLVPIDLALRIAHHRAKEVWGTKLCADDPVLCSDEQGKLVAYLFTFRLGLEEFPRYDELLKMVQDAREEEHRIMDTPLHEFAAETRESAEILAADQGNGKEFGQVPSVRPDGEPSHLQLALKKREKLEAARRRQCGTGLFGTVFVSARFDLPPIPLMSDHLAPLYCNLDLAIERGRNVAGSPNVQFHRYYFLGHRGQYFGLTCGDKELLLDAFSTEPVQTPAAVLSVPAATLPNQLAETENTARRFRESVSKQWKQLMDSLK